MGGKPRMKTAADLRAAELRRLKKVFKGKESVLADLEARLEKLKEGEKAAKLE